MAIGDSLDDIYPELLRRHHEHPLNFEVLAPATAVVTESNPVCGDEITLYLRAAGDKVEAAGFQGHLCAVAKASASLMSEAIKGKELNSVRRLARDFESMMKGGEVGSLGELDGLRSVRRYRVRVRCALLPWQALDKAIGRNDAQ